MTFDRNDGTGHPRGSGPFGNEGPDGSQGPSGNQAWQPGQNSYGEQQDPWSRPPGGQKGPYQGSAQDPSSANPYGQNPDEQNPYGSNPYGQNPHGQNPYQPPPPPRRRRRTALWVILGLVVLCLLVCVGTVAYAFMQVGPGVKRQIAHVTSTEMASQLGAGGNLEPGEYVITGQELTDGINRQINQGATNENVKGVQVAIQPQSIEITVDLGSRTVSYRAGVTVQDGRVKLTDPRADAGALGNLIPSDWIAGGLEQGMNQYFEANGLTVSSVELERGQIRIVTEAKGSGR